MTIDYGILGAGGQAAETEDLARPDRVAFRAVSAEYLDSERPDVVDIAAADGERTSMHVIAAVGAPGLRRRLVENWRGSTYRLVVASSATVAASASIGEGSTLASNSVVSTGVVIGPHSLLNTGSSVSHQSSLGSFVTLSPGALVAANCVIGDGVFLGIGAVVSNGVSIASGSVIGAGTVVLRDIEEAGVYVGYPARRLRDQEGWLSAI